MTRNAFSQILFSSGAGVVSEASFKAGNIISGQLRTSSSRGKFRNWKLRPIVPIVESKNPEMSTILGAVTEVVPLRIRYWGGSEPGLSREISPAFIFTRPDQSDILAWYEARDHVEQDAILDPPLDLPGDSVEWKEFSQFLEQRCPSYVLAWCHQRTSQRCFCVSRMELA